MSILIVVLILSGLVSWDEYFAPYTSIGQKRIAILIHDIAAIAIICVWIVHLYAAIWVQGTLPAMVRGVVTGGWAWRHHRKWLKELVATKSNDHNSPGPTPAE
jgi:formate dehydrogenase subunit gamma